MKLSLVLFTLMSASFSPLFAQKTSTTQPVSNAGPNSTTVVTNRQQKLYDHYHSYSTKAGTQSTEPTPVGTTTSPVGAERPVGSPAVPSTPTVGVNERPQPVATTEPMSPEGNASSKFRIGIRGGVTYPLYLEKVAGREPVLGFVGGITFNLGTGAISFQPEINYIRNSFKLTSLNTTYAVDEIQVPLLLKISTGSYAGSRFFVNVGPYASYITSASEDGKKYSLSGFNGRFTFGGAAGVGAAIKAGPGHVTLEVRGLYFLGDTDSGVITNVKIISGQGTVGYIFPLGRSR